MFVIIFINLKGKANTVIITISLLFISSPTFLLFIASFLMKIDLCNGRKGQVDYKIQSLSGEPIGCCALEGRLLALLISTSV